MANFYNTMGSQIIPSQKPMLLEPLLEFESAVQKPTVGSRADGTVTWSNPDQCQAFVKRLQVSVGARSPRDYFSASLVCGVTARLGVVMATVAGSGREAGV